MRISEDRYDRDRQRLELALRLLTHEARTQTIRVWTGLSDDRIRKLYRSYLWRAACYVPRHRGAVFLADCLARGDQLRIGRCCDCGGIIVVERFPIREKRCQHYAAAARRG
jgi:hypothetical protein